MKIGYYVLLFWLVDIKSGLLGADLAGKLTALDRPVNEKPAYITKDPKVREQRDEFGAKIVIGSPNTKAVVKEAMREGKELSAFDMQVGATKEGKPVYLEIFSEEVTPKTPESLSRADWSQFTKSIEGLNSSDIRVQKCEGVFKCVRLETGPDGKPRCTQFRCVTK